MVSPGHYTLFPKIVYERGVMSCQLAIVTNYTNDLFWIDDDDVLLSQPYFHDRTYGLYYDRESDTAVLGFGGSLSDEPDEDFAMDALFISVIIGLFYAVMTYLHIIKLARFMKEKKNSSGTNQNGELVPDEQEVRLLIEDEVETQEKFDPVKTYLKSKSMMLKKLDRKLDKRAKRQRKRSAELDTIQEEDEDLQSETTHEK